MGKGKGVKLPVNKSEIPPGSMKEVKVSDTLTVLVVHVRAKVVHVRIASVAVLYGLRCRLLTATFTRQVINARM